MKATPKTIEKLEINENEIVVVRLQDHNTSLICKPYKDCLIGLTINIISYREFLLSGTNKKLEQLGFNIICKEINSDNNLIISSKFSTKNLDVIAYPTKTTNSASPTWSTIQRGKEKEFFKDCEIFEKAEDDLLSLQLKELAL